MNIKDDRMDEEIWRVENGELVTNPLFPTYECKSTYPVDLARIQTHEDILRWIVHLSRKVWGTPKVLRAFAVAACFAKGWRLPEYLRD